jgi:hypothetical protein
MATMTSARQTGLMVPGFQAAPRISPGFKTDTRKTRAEDLSGHIGSVLARDFQ